MDEKETFEKLISRPPETLRSRFKISHGMVLNLLQRDEEIDDPTRRNFASLRELIAGCHEDDGAAPPALRWCSSLAPPRRHRGDEARLRRYRWSDRLARPAVRLLAYTPCRSSPVETRCRFSTPGSRTVGDLLSTRRRRSSRIRDHPAQASGSAPRSGSRRDEGGPHPVQADGEARGSSIRSRSPTG
ncbi:MAG: DUF3516 domain-containing protein [Thermoanaerobaculia bacterium]